MCCYRPLRTSTACRCYCPRILADRKNLISIIIIRNYVRVRSTAGTQLVIMWVACSLVCLQRSARGDHRIEASMWKEHTFPFPCTRTMSFFSERANVTTEAATRSFFCAMFLRSQQGKYDTDLAEETTARAVAVGWTMPDRCWLQRTGPSRRPRRSRSSTPRKVTEAKVVITLSTMTMPIKPAQRGNGLDYGRGRRIADDECPGFRETGRPRTRTRTSTESTS